MKYLSYAEKKVHGSASFPIQYYDIHPSHPQYRMATHWHKEMELIHVIEGRFTVYLNNTVYPLSAGDVLLIESGTLHRGEPENALYECVVFHPNMLLKQQNDILSSLISPFLKASVTIVPPWYHNGDAVTDLVLQLCNTLKNTRPFFELQVYRLLYQIFAVLYQTDAVKPAEKTVQTQQTEAVTHLLTWMEQNYTEAVTLAQMSEVSGFSRKYLCRIFKDYTAKTPIGYINELRIEHACHEMAVNQKSVTAAAFDSGFNDLSYFCKTFKKHIGITANAYKKKYMLT